MIVNERWDEKNAVDLNVEDYLMVRVHRMRMKRRDMSWRTKGRSTLIILSLSYVFFIISFSS